MGSMNCYVIAATDLETADVRKAFPDAYEVQDGVWVAPSPLDTCADVSGRLGIDGTGRKSGVVVAVGPYYGYHDNALWEKLGAWKRRDS